MVFAMVATHQELRLNVSVVFFAVSLHNSKLKQANLDSALTITSY
jgi:hypothetical protein